MKPDPSIPSSVEPDQLPRALFGYDRSKIVALLDAMGERIWTLTQERAEQEQRISELELEAKQAQERQGLIGEALIAAREEAKAIVEKAHGQAEEMLRSAQGQARGIVADAEQAAGEKAKELIEAAQQKRQALLAEAARARAFVEDTHEQLGDFLTSALKWYEQTKSAGDLGADEPAPSDDTPAEQPGADAPATSPAERADLEAVQAEAEPGRPSNGRSSIAAA
jgi:cell division initiation protein